MKHVIPRLRIGQKVWATVEELLEKDQLLVNFEGDILRVTNFSQRRFRSGQRIQLHVEGLSPLQFRLVEPRRLLDRQLDIEI